MAVYVIICNTNYLFGRFDIGQVKHKLYVLLLTLAWRINPVAGKRAI
jgi:hypothetical protein